MKKINLSIPEPCHESWDRMSPQGNGKFCGSCQKAVIDFTTMSDRELVQFFKNHQGSVCGRLQQNQLHRDILVPRKRVPWIRYFFQFTLPAFLISMKAGAQGKVSVSTEKTECRMSRIGEVAIPLEEPAVAGTIIRGKVTDQNGSPLPFASINIKGSHSGTITDSSGLFRIKTDVVHPVILASMVGYEVQEKISDSSYMEFNMKPYNGDMGVVVMVGMIRPQRPRKIPLIHKVAEKAFTKFAVFPNPVRSMTSFKIHPVNMTAGFYQLSVVNTGGEIIQTNDIEVTPEKNTIDVFLNAHPAGVYFLKITSRKNGQSFTERIVVE